MPNVCGLCRKTINGPSITVPANQWKRTHLLSQLIDGEAQAKIVILLGGKNGKRICGSHAPAWDTWKKRWTDQNDNNEVKKTQKLLDVGDDTKLPLKMKMKDEVPDPHIDNINIRPDSPTPSQKSHVSYGSYMDNEIKDPDWLLGQGNDASGDIFLSDEEELEDESCFDSNRFIVSGQKLIELVSMVARFTCICAQQEIRVKPGKWSSTVLIGISCANCAKSEKWSSLEKEHEADRRGKLNAELPLAATTSGISFTRLSVMAKLLRIAFPSNSTYKRVMQNHGWNSIVEVYKEDHGDTLRRIKDAYDGDQASGIEVETDGQYDSPGYSALICKSSYFETKTGLCLVSNVIDKREEECSSNGLELVGMKKGLAEIEALGIKVKSVTSDKNFHVGRFMHDEHGPHTKNAIVHHLDFWHVVKNFNSRFIKETKGKKNVPLLNWRKSIINYFYAVREIGGGNPQLIRELLWGMRYHVLGIHEWKHDKNFRQTHKCPHDDDLNTNSFLIRGSHAHKTFLSLMSDAFIENMARISSAGSTSRVECFHSISLMYTPKGNFLSREHYELRNLCSVLRYNYLRKSELDGHRTVVREQKVHRKYRDQPSKKKIRKGEDPLAWMRKVLQVSASKRLALVEQEEEGTNNTDDENEDYADPSDEQRLKDMWKVNDNEGNSDEDSDSDASEYSIEL